MPLAIDLAGQTFGRLTVIGQAGRRGGQIMWRCRCSCGRETAVRSYSLRQGHTKSCGCLFRDIRKRGANFRHGGRKTAEYAIWNAMLARCNNPRAEKYPIYGARGIRVCARWNKFANFIADMGRRSSSAHSIDRIDNDGNYEPGNCRWATPTEQAANTRTARPITFNGRTQSPNLWAKEIGVSEGTFRRRIRSGQTIDQIQAERASRTCH